MTHVGKYIAGQILVAALFTTIALCTAVLLIQSLRLVDLIVNRGLPLSDFFYMAAMMLPRFVAFMMPLAVFAAALFTYNRMMSDSEVVILRSSGLSPMQIAKPALIVAAAASILGYALTLYFVPASLNSFKASLLEVRSNLASSLLKERQFTVIGDTVTVYFRDQTAAGEMLDLMVHDARDPDQQVTILAERGVLVDGPEGVRLVVLNGSQQSFSEGTLHYLTFERYTLDFASSNPAIADRWREPSERFLPDLLFPDMDNAGDAAHLDELWAEAHERLTSPLLPLAYTALGLGILFSGAFTRRGQGKLVIAASLAVLAVLVAFLGASNVATKDSGAVIALYLAVVVPTAVGLYLIGRSGRLHQSKVSTGPV